MEWSHNNTHRTFGLNVSLTVNIQLIQKIWLVYGMRSFQRKGESCVLIGLQHYVTCRYYNSIGYGCMWFHRRKKIMRKKNLQRKSMCPTLSDLNSLNMGTIANILLYPGNTLQEKSVISISLLTVAWPGNNVFDSRRNPPVPPRSRVLSWKRQGGDWRVTAVHMLHTVNNDLTWSSVCLFMCVCVLPS